MVLLIDSTHPEYSGYNDSFAKAGKLKQKPTEGESILFGCFRQIAGSPKHREGVPSRIAEDIGQIIILTDEKMDIRADDLKSFGKRKLPNALCDNSNIWLAKYKELISAAEVIRWSDLGISDRELKLLHSGNNPELRNIDIGPLYEIIKDSEEVIVYSAYTLTEPLIRFILKLKNTGGYTYSYLRNEPRGFRGQECFVINDSNEFFSFRAKFLKELKNKRLDENLPAFIDRLFVLDSPNVYQNDQPDDFIWQYIGVLSGSVKKVILSGGGKYIVNRFLSEIAEALGPIATIDCSKPDEISRIGNFNGNVLVILNIDKVSHSEFKKIYKELVSASMDSKAVVIIADRDDLAEDMHEFKLIRLPEESDLKNYFARIFFHFAIYERLIPFVDITDGALYEKRSEEIYRLASNKLIIPIFQTVSGFGELKSLVNELWKYKIDFDMALNDYSFWYQLKQFVLSRYSIRSTTEKLDAYLESLNNESVSPKVSQPAIDEVDAPISVESKATTSEMIKTEKEDKIPWFKLTHVKIDDQDGWILSSDQELINKDPIGYRSKKGIMIIAYLVRYYRYPNEIDVDKLANIIDKWHGRTKRMGESTKGSYHTLKEDLRYLKKKQPDFGFIISHVKITKSIAYFAPRNELEVEIIDPEMPQGKQTA